MPCSRPRCFPAYSLPAGVQVNLNLESKAKHSRQKQQHQGHRKSMGTGHSFSAENPYGKRDAADKRQFVRI